MKSLALWLALALLAGTPAQAPAQDPDDHAGHDHAAAAVEEDHVTLDAATQAEFGIEIATAGSVTLREQRTLTGEVRADQDRVAHITPRFAGVVQSVRARIGDRVRAGQVLARVENDESLTDFSVRTLIAGTVIARHASLGEAVSRDEPMFVVADLDTVWIDLAVYLRDIEAITEGMKVSVSCGRHDEVRQSQIAYVSPVVDESTRTGTSRVIMPNHDGHWRPGMFVTAEVATEAQDVPVGIPETALLTVAERLSVFVQEDGAFAARPVTVGHRSGGMVEIIAGLAPGERYVSRGGFTLKAELDKTSFGDGHNH